MKPTRLELRKDHYWIYLHFTRNKLLDKYCQPKMLKNTTQAIKAFQKTYDGIKPRRRTLQVEHSWIYCHFVKHPELMNKYCQPRSRKTPSEAVSEFVKIYGKEKPLRSDLEKEHPWIYNHFLRNKELMNNYCLPRTRRSKRHSQYKA